MSLENESTGSLFGLKWSKHRSTIVEEAGDSDSDDARLQGLSDALKRVILHYRVHCTKAEKTN